MHSEQHPGPVRKFWLLAGIVVGVVLVPLAGGISYRIVWERVRRRASAGADRGWHHVLPHLERAADQLRSGWDSLERSVWAGGNDEDEETPPPRSTDG